ncbi:toxin-antitoxin system HicB family antitoxin [Pantoea rodasii]|uniref:Toxin-antitoxin system HicB family antitoxin n=1 Tax=Pantoea rodasii TaxID=1076549 RepID=A0A2M9WIF6_9GAMM|nr:type II toxin-antitoxin system HicB family antitoxin [Pantoea rodasii]ORM64203.1 antitoxin HicB [Pantoea rodasii]PJZ07331.1 toxin-antitoxin system HicB family antitoxin [Pantoea rodasii]
MNKLFNYKGFFGSIDFSMEELSMCGKIECINDLVTYEAKDLASLKAEFEAAVDDYLETCAAIGKEPDKTMSGTFNVRIGEELHKQAYLMAKSKGMNLNEFIKDSVKEKLQSKNEYHFHFDKKPEEKTIALSFGSQFRAGTKWSAVTHITHDRAWDGQHDA